MGPGARCGADTPVPWLHLPRAGPARLFSLPPPSLRGGGGPALPPSVLPWNRPAPCAGMVGFWSRERGLRAPRPRGGALPDTPRTGSGAGRGGVSGGIGVVCRRGGAVRGAARKTEGASSASVSPAPPPHALAAVALARRAMYAAEGTANTWPCPSLPVLPQQNSRRTNAPYNRTLECTMGQAGVVSA